MMLLQFDLPRLLRSCSRGGVCSIRIFCVFALATVVAYSSAAFTAPQADAAFVTRKDGAMDAIYGQASFGANPIDVRYLPTIVHVDPSFLNIDTQLKQVTLFNLYNSNTIHYAYYVDEITQCGSFSHPNIVGCGDVSGDDYVIESEYAARDGAGEELMAHELGHNLGLGHDGGANDDNLMDSVVGNPPGPPVTTTLTVAQANTILNNSTIQTDAFGKFVLIQPVLIVATLVPEPSTMAMALGLFGFCTLNLRRRRG